MKLRSLSWRLFKVFLSWRLFNLLLLLQEVVARNGVFKQTGSRWSDKQRKTQKGWFILMLFTQVHLHRSSQKKGLQIAILSRWTRAQQTSVSSSLIPTIAILSRSSITHVHPREPLFNFSLSSHLFLFLWF